MEEDHDLVIRYAAGDVATFETFHVFSHAEIAEMTGSTKAAVKQRLYRALKALRQNE